MVRFPFFTPVMSVDVFSLQASASLSQVRPCCCAGWIWAKGWPQPHRNQVSSGNDAERCRYHIDTYIYIHTYIHIYIIAHSTIKHWTPTQFQAIEPQQLQSHCYLTVFSVLLLGAHTISGQL